LYQLFEYMKPTFFLIAYFITATVYAQQKDFTVQKLSLPSEIEYYDNQFSGMCIYKDVLFLMSESRLQDNREAKLYAIKTADIDRKIMDTSFVLPFKKYTITNLAAMRNKMNVLGDDYEGLEAILMEDNEVYLTVETATPSNNCYLLKGILKDSTIELDIKFLSPLPKPIDKNNNHIYNAGFEAMAMVDKTVLNFFEYNWFSEKNLAIAVTPTTLTSVMYQLPTVEKIPFRITDITKTSKNTFTAINFFYKGDGEDTVYRVNKKDKANDKLIRDGYGYKSYCRLVKLKYKSYKFTWEPLWEFPVEFMSYNWEAIAAYKDGYFIMNDKYTSARPYSSILLYIKPF
jgi:hypothetical protein